MMRRVIGMILFLMASLAAGAASSQVYKWVDEKGTINYSNSPPADANAARKAQVVADKVSVISADPAVTRAMQSQAEANQRALAEKVDRLERQLDAERQSRQSSASAAEAQAQAAYDQCLANRGVDCGMSYGGYGGYYPYGAPVVVVRGARVSPALPLSQRSGSRPVSFRSSSARAGHSFSSR